MREGSQVQSLGHSSPEHEVHEDLKPVNILLKLAGKDLSVKLSDFGLSKAIEGGKSSTKLGTQLT